MNLKKWPPVFRAAGIKHESTERFVIPADNFSQES